MLREKLVFALHLFLFLPQFFVSAAAGISPAYTPTDYILLNCGATSNTTSLDDREWDTDSGPKYTQDNILNSKFTSTSTASEQNPSVEQIPYSSARIFHSKFTYTFHISTAGQLFLRLYFYPTNYATGFDKTKSFFSVNAANQSLLSDFSPWLNLQPPSFTLVKEYIITVNQSRLLVVTFTPSSNSYAFVNGIEVVSIPDNFYIKGNEDENSIKMVGQNNRFHIGDSMLLEKLYRLNVGGGGDISPTDDTGMFRSWVVDDPWIAFGVKLHREVPINYTNDTPPYTAPQIVYSSARIMQKDLTYGYNLTWSFEVDSGFYYLLRLYLCELMLEVTGPGQRVFSIFINNQTAEQSADVILWSRERGIPVYKDYVVFVSDKPDGSKGKKDLWLAMHPDMVTYHEFDDVILNGLEIFKLSQPGSSLAAPNPELLPSPALETKKPAGRIENSGASNSGLVAACIGGSLAGIILLLSIVGFILFRRRREKSQDVDTKSDKSRSTNISSLPSVRSRKFSLEEIKLATSNFDDNFVIGIGGFGNVYKGYMENGTLTVAIKRLNPSSRQGYHEFQTEISMLSNLRHLNLVPLIGYCDDSGEMILVYDYMVHGTLRSHLYRGNNPPLSWKQRLQICIGAAKGLHYLHAGAERVIIHRDVKSTNILLDEKMVAKVSDFGLSKMGPSDTSVTHVSTIVKGSFGYLDPEYYRRQQLTTKSDVYSFGVVLFEVLCARPVVMSELPNEQKNLAEWARNCYKNGSLGELLDQNLMDEIAVESLNKFGELGYSCLKDRGIDRPTMSDVVWSLEFALQLQESHEKLMHPTAHLLSGAKDNIAKNNDDDDDLVSTKIVGKDKSSDISTTTSSSEGFKSGSIFSEILNPNAR